MSDVYLVHWYCSDGYESCEGNLGVFNDTFAFLAYAQAKRQAVENPEMNVYIARGNGSGEIKDILCYPSLDKDWYPEYYKEKGITVSYAHVLAFIAYHLNDTNDYYLDNNILASHKDPTKPLLILDDNLPYLLTKELGMVQLPYGVDNFVPFLRPYFPELCVFLDPYLDWEENYCFCSHCQATKEFNKEFTL